MSLQVWLPLNGNLNNQGLKTDITIAGAASYMDDGKIGSKCLNSANDIVITTGLSGIRVWSFCFWGYVESALITTNWTGITSLLDGASGLRTEVCPLGNYNNNAYCYSTHNNAGAALSTSSMSTPNGTSYYDAWAHCCLTSDGTTIRKYMNGIEVASMPYDCDGAITGVIYLRNNNKIRKNDVRFYDHTLSAREVKEISKGLVFHLPMREGGQALATSYVYPTFNTSYSTSYWSHWNASGANGSYSQNSDINYIYEFSNSNYSHCVSNDATATGNYLLYQEKLFDGGYRSFQAIIKESNGLPINENICYPVWNGSTHLSTPSNKWTRIVDLGNGFYWCICEGINQTTSPTSANSHLVGIYVKPGYTIYVSEAYVEDGKQFCTLPFFKNPNLITSLKAGGQTTVSNLKVTTSGTNADTYFYFNLSEPLVSGETYTLSCVASNIPDGEYWGFPIANQNNTAITMAIYNGVNTYTFTANDTAADKLQIIMDDNYRGNAYANQCVFDDWKLTKSNLIDDCSGYGNNARLNGSISYFKSEGRNSKCCKLMSTNVGTSTLAGASYLSAPLSLPQMSKLTIAFWTNPETWSRGGMIAATTSLTGFPSDYTIVPFHNYDSYIRFTDINGNYKNINYNSFTTANEWHHYAFTFDGTTIRVYKDGVELTDIAQSFSAPTKLPAFYNLFIGLSHAGGVYRTTRSMWSDFRIYTTCLSDIDIKELATVAASIDNNGNIYAYELEE